MYKYCGSLLGCRCTLSSSACKSCGVWQFRDKYLAYTVRFNHGFASSCSSGSITLSDTPRHRWWISSICSRNRSAAYAGGSGGLPQRIGVPAGHGYNGTPVRAGRPVGMTPSDYTASYSAQPWPGPDLGGDLAVDGVPSHVLIASG